jgi:hypothetical protein
VASVLFQPCRQFIVLPPSLSALVMSSAVAPARVNGDSPLADIQATLKRCLTRGIPLDPMPV